LTAHSPSAGRMPHLALHLFDDLIHIIHRQSSTRWRPA
jgi:hypothetical protein